MKTRNHEMKRLQKLAGVVDEVEDNYLEEPHVGALDDVPSVKLHVDDNNVLTIHLSDFYHGPENGKIPLLVNNPGLQELLMKALQYESQKAFRRAVHSVLGIPYGLPENEDKNPK
jgi:hypothetical protein